MLPNCRFVATSIQASLALIVLSQAVYAQDDLASESDSEIGGGRLSASIRTDAFYTDNFFYEPDGATKEEVTGAVVRPAVGYVVDTGRITLKADASGEYGVFDLPGDADDYLDGIARASVDVTPTSRHRFSLSTGYAYDHDPFGIDRTEAVTGSPLTTRDIDKYTRANAGLQYRYGAPGAKVNAGLGVSGSTKEYFTNRSDTQFLDYDTTAVNYAIFYNHSAKTSSLIDLVRTDVDFDRDFSGGQPRNGVLQRLRVGVRWLATAKTSGDVRVGLRRRTFDSGAPEVEGFDWEAGVGWSPVAGTLIDLRTGRSEQQSYLADTRLIDVRSATLELKQTLNSRMNLSAAVEGTKADFVSSGTGREDDILNAVIGIGYVALSYLTVVADVQHTIRDSTDPQREYERFAAHLGIRIGR